MPMASTRRGSVRTTILQQRNPRPLAADNTAEKQRERPFEKGMSGNPNGRPKGSRNATTLALETLLDGQAKALTQKAIDHAILGVRA
jgi:Family of unknown function (DUF5681)